MTRKQKSPLDRIEELTRLLTHEQLCNLVLGIKPDYDIGKVHVDGVFPASQFHFRLDHTITPTEARRIRKAVSFPFAGLVGIKVGKKTVPAIDIFSCRVIITTVTPGVSVSSPMSKRPTDVIITPERQ